MAGIVDLYMVYEFIKRLATPFDETNAFKLGLIDADGNRLKKAKTEPEKRSMTYFDRLIFNLKRLLAKVPGGSSKIATYAAALLLLRERDEKLNVDPNYLEEQFMMVLDSVDINDYSGIAMVLEDFAGNATGASVVGTGDDKATWRTGNKVNRVGVKKQGRPRDMWSQANGRKIKGWND